MIHSVLTKIALVTSIVISAGSIIHAKYALADGTPNEASESPVEDRRLTTEDIHEIYKARDLGTRLYSEKKYAEALPHVMTAATHGLKKSQAQLGFMHLNGLGNAKKDTRYAIGWLGVAADGVSEPEIETYFKRIWEKIPRESVPGYEALVDNFVAKYGTEANNVQCRRVNTAGSRIRKVRCMLTDANGRLITDMMEDVSQGPGGIESIGSGPSGVPSP